MGAHGRRIPNITIGDKWLVLLTKDSFDENAVIFESKSAAEYYANYCNTEKIDQRSDWIAVNLWEAFEEKVRDAAYNAMDEG